MTSSEETPRTDARRRRHFAVWHPPLLAVFPLLYVFAANQAELPASVLGWSLPAAILATLGVQAAATRLCGSADKGGAIAGAVVGAPFIYPVLEALDEMVWNPFGWTTATGLTMYVLFRAERAARRGNRRAERGRIAAALALVLLLGAGGTVLALRPEWLKLSPAWENVTLPVVWLALAVTLLTELARLPDKAYPVINGFGNRMAAVLVCLPLLSIVPFQLERSRVEPGAPGTAASGPLGERAKAKFPDIYHVVLDMYGRPDVLRSKHGIDVDPFVRALEERGFSVAARATSNYTRTMFSIGAMFNYEYVNRSGPLADLDPVESLTVIEHARHNRVLSHLQEFGYASYAFHSGFPTTEEWPVDRYLGFERSESALFLQTLAELTPAPEIIGMIHRGESPRVRSYRRRAYFALETLPQMAGYASPKFVLAHILPPHQPFVMDEKGEPMKVEGHGQEVFHQPTYRDPAEVEAYMEGYRRQITGLNGLLIESLDALLSNVNRPSLIIVHGDHGPGPFRPESEAVERFATLLAVRFVGPRPDDFEEDLSLVNLYRLIFREYFDRDLPLLENRHFMTYHPSSGSTTEWSYMDLTPVLRRVSKQASRDAGREPERSAVRADRPEPNPFDFRRVE